MEGVLVGRTEGDGVRECESERVPKMEGEREKRRRRRRGGREDLKGCMK